MIYDDSFEPLVAQTYMFMPAARAQRVGSCYLEVLFGTTGVDTWCYLECYLVLPGVLPAVVLPGRYLGFYFGVGCFFVPKYPRFSNSNFWKKINFHLEMLPGPTPVVVTGLPGPPSALGFFDFLGKGTDANCVTKEPQIAVRQGTLTTGGDQVR